MAKKSKYSVLPLALGPETHVDSVGDMVRAIIKESDLQVAEKNLGPEGVDDFRMACDSLNWWRLHHRVIEELGLPELDACHKEMMAKVAAGVCVARGYTQDDFTSARLATMDRVRLPWGFTSLRLAVIRGLRNPVRLLHPDLKDAKLPALLVATALQLLEMAPDSSGIFYLPIDSLRGILNQRKIVVAGAVTRLIQAKLIVPENDGMYRIGRAREFRFTGELGKDYDLLQEEVFQETV